MTKERIFRLTEKSADWLKELLESVYAGELGPIPKEFYACPLTIKGRLDLEPAPPKDWVPSCFMANSSNINKCAFPKRSIERLMNESCENCPFRKLED